MTVIDALNIYDVLSSLDTLAQKNSTNMTGEDDRNEDDDEVDDRSIAQLMLDQIEFANVIVLSKAHLLPEQGAAAAVSEIKALLERLNASATVLVPSEPHFADLTLDRVVNTGLFDMEEAQTSAGWIKELAKEAAGGGGHTPETEEYGISSMVFRRARRPFHPGRLSAMLKGFGDYASSVAAGANSKKKRRRPSAAAEVFKGVVRAKGTAAPSRHRTRTPSTSTRRGSTSISRSRSAGAATRCRTSPRCPRASGTTTSARSTRRWSPTARGAPRLSATATARPSSSGCTSTRGASSRSWRRRC